MSCIKTKAEQADDAIQDLSDVIAYYGTLTNVNYEQKWFNDNIEITADIKFYSLPLMCAMIKELKCAKEYKQALEIFKRRVDESESMRDLLQQLLLVEKLEYGDTFLNFGEINE